MSLDNILKVKFGRYIYLILHAEFCATVKIYNYLNIYKSCQNSASVLKWLNRQTDRCKHYWIKEGYVQA